MKEKSYTEVKKLRRENAKVFRGEDGVYKMEVYPHRVHYYEETTNSFEENNSKCKKTTRGYMTTDGVREREFITDADMPETVAFRTGDAGFSMRFAGLSSGKKMICETRRGKFSLRDAKPITERDELSPDEAYPSVKYEDVLDEVDVEYVSMERELKENIIIKDRLGSYAFDFVFETDHLILKTDAAHRMLAFFDRRKK
ncbi:MAG: hypothetical protein J6M38_13310, partial [Lentisphaeria bacterium]|nr:hypothetical protein [Lentisphaeria bacterium]